MKLLRIYRVGRPDAVVYMHWNEYTTVTKDGVQLERLLMRAAQSKIIRKSAKYGLIRSAGRGLGTRLPVVVGN